MSRNKTTQTRGPYLAEFRVQRSQIICAAYERTTITPSDSAVTNMAPHFVLVTRGVAVDARELGDGEGHDRQRRMKSEGEDEWVARGEDIQLKETHS